MTTRLPELISPVLATNPAPGLPSILTDRPAHNPCRGDPYDTYLGTLKSEESKHTMAGCLDRIARIVLEEEAGAPLPHEPRISGRGRSWWVLRYEHTAKIRDLLGQQTRSDGTRWSPSHINKHLSALRGVLEQAWELGGMTTDEYHRAVKFKNDKGKRLSHGRSLADEEFAALLRHCVNSDGLAGIRDAAIIATFQSTGARRAEVASARIEDFDAADRNLRFLGKGDKERDVPVHEVTVMFINDWLARLNVRSGPLFRPVNRWGQILPQHMNPRSFGRIWDIRRRAAGLPPSATHDARRTLAGQLLDQNVDLVRVQEILGHASPTTTAQYDRRPARERRAAIDLLKLPTPDELRRAEP